MRRVALTVRRLPTSDARRGQALTEFAFLAPVMMLLILGMIDLGRGFYYQVEVTDAARDAARVLIAPATSGGSTGPGMSAACDAATRDLMNVGVANVTCQAGTYPFTYSSPSANQATVYIDCGGSPDCSSTPSSGTSTCDTDFSPHTCIAIGIDYTFSILSPEIQQIGGPTLQLTDSGQMVTLW